jgi:hypothetical protein
MMLCETCVHRRPPNDEELRGGAGPATSAAERQVVLKRRRELEMDLSLEEASVPGPAVKLRRRPLAHAWCSVWSDDDDRRYYFCEWLGDRDCERFSCQYLDSACTLCNGASGLCLRKEAAASRGVPAESEAASSQWQLPLGDVFRLAMSRRAVDGFEEGFELHYGLEPADNADGVCISGKGLFQTYLVFGGPGAGKTHFFKYLLWHILSHKLRPGCLVLDPKGVLEEWLGEVMKGLGRWEDLAVVSANRDWSCNVFGSTLSSRELGRLLSDVVLAEAAGVDEGWQVFVSDLLESGAVVAAAARERKTVTASELLADILTRKKFIRDGRIIKQYPVLIRAQQLYPAAEDREIREACDRVIQYFVSTKEEQRRFVRQLVERTLGELRAPEWLYLSDSGESEDLYSGILESGRVVLVSVGQRSPSFQRSLCTLMKAVFQQTVLSALSTAGGSVPSPRFSILATDEYAQVVAEGQSGLVSDSRFFSLSREAHCMSLLALQSVATARSRFHATVRDRWDGIVGNVNVKVFMRLNDIETAKMGSDFGGLRHSLIKMVGKSVSEASSGVNESFTVVENSRVPEWFLTNGLGQGEAFVHGTLDGESSPVSCFIRVPKEDRPSGHASTFGEPEGDPSARA